MIYALLGSSPEHASLPFTGLDEEGSPLISATAFVLGSLDFLSNLKVILKQSMLIDYAARFD